MQVTPFVQVRDLAPSASFYAAIVQPLGLRYISASSSSIIFGDVNSPTPEPVFEVKQSTDPSSRPVRRCRLILSANSPSVVSAFHTAALRANPDLEGAGANVNYLRFYNTSDSTSESCARAADFDGNIMEAVHIPHPDYAGSHAGSSVRRTHSSSHEVSRVLDWNLDVGTTSVPSRSVASSATPSSTAVSRTSDGEPYTLMRKSITTSTVEASPREESKGFSASAMVGTILSVAAGVAAGGALTYSMMKGGERERERMAYREAAPPLSRRTTYPDNNSDNRPRYYPPSSYSGGHSQAGGPRSRVVEELDDRASRHSSHHSTGSRTRGRSEAGSTRRPLMIADVEHRSNAGSKHSDSPRLLMDTEHRSHSSTKHNSDSRSHAGSRHSATTPKHSPRYSPESDQRGYLSSKHASPRHREADAETYISARSERSAATVRQARPPASVETAPPSRAQSQAGSRYSAATARPSGPGRAHSYASARSIPFQESYVGSCHNGWDDDLSSIAPSESISNIGYRHARRSQRA
ncbi:uncharacterized protein F4807DRAFT_462550 [Annulohypoxylon truncatum]|uniref:uncharacterized protein n=1 Tax=Annulohypoxylon truncatum TaxID=327061 RepID=UPI0020082771|nr:uncharacterized protein F4807DRAFT_462550 [Annulohypoxylon truncatum]KAI1207393.1 hypothetical protein F4807DRAFT_462550 [Annulohypoxylon truncatum]